MKKLGALGITLLQFPPDGTTRGVRALGRFLEQRFKRNDYLRFHIKRTHALKLPIKGVQPWLGVLDTYEHPCFVVDRVGKILLKNGAATHLLKGVLLSRSLYDLEQVGEFTKGADEPPAKVTVAEILHQYKPKLFVFKSGSRTFHVFLKKLPYGIQGVSYLLVLKGHVRLGTSSDLPFYLDSQIVVQSIFHEIKSPLSSIGLNLEWISQKKLSETLSEDLSCCLNAFDRLKGLVSGLPQFFSWNPYSRGTRVEPLSKLLQNILLTLSVQLKKPTSFMLSEHSALLRQVATYEIRCNVKTVLQSFQELLHFLAEFVCVDNGRSITIIPFLNQNSFYIDVIVSKGDFDFFTHFAKTTPSLDDQSDEASVLKIRDAVRHMYFSRILKLFRSSAAKLWVLKRMPEMAFRCEFRHPVQRKGQASVKYERQTYTSNSSK